MRIMQWNRVSSLALASVLPCVVFAVSGCNSGSEPATTEQASDVHDNDGHDHGGWWCSEHGVPEGECALCDISLVAAFKAKGDWCDEHNCPDSQCFVCNPENFEKFATRYEAKFGEQPPKPTE